MLRQIKGWGYHNNKCKTSLLHLFIPWNEIKKQNQTKNKTKQKTPTHTTMRKTECNKSSTCIKVTVVFQSGSTESNPG